MRGGEKVVELLCDCFPEAELYTLVCDPSRISNKIKKHKITTSFIQQLPWGVKKYQMYLPLHPFAIEQFDLSSYDLVISSESGTAKGVILPPNVCHICYCHSPMRYLWNMYHEYLQTLNWPQKVIWLFFSNYLRQWDYVNSQRVDYFIANSHNVKKRINKYFNRDAEVIHPPVDSSKFQMKSDGDFYLFVGQLNPYKNADMAVKAFNQMKDNLIVIGDGPQLNYLKKIAEPNVKILGRQPDETLIDYYATCKGFIFPGEEDFGITPLEAMASGKPVIAYGKGGALETVTEGKTGIFFNDPTEESLIEAIEKSKKIEWDSEFIQNHSKQFDIAIAKDKLQEFIMHNYGKFSERN